MPKDFRKIPPNRLHAYNGGDVISTLLLKRQQEQQAGAFETTWRHLHGPAQWALGHMERWGAVVSEEKVREYHAFLDGEIVRYRDELGQVGAKWRDINPRSPKQMGELLFKDLGFKVKRKTDKGNPSLALGTIHEMITERWGVPFDKMTEKPKLPLEVLAEKAGQSPELHAVLTLLRLKDTLNQQSKYGLGYLKYLGFDGRVHTTYKIVRTQRTSSSEPNLQNLTSPDDDELVDPANDPGMRARGVFDIPGDEWVIVSLDFSQIELRVAAMLSGDEDMAAAFESGVDFHTATACKMFGKAAADIAKLERRAAKVINFGICYGKTAKGIAEELDITVQKAQGYVDAWLRAFPKFAAWRRRQIAVAYQTGLIWGRHGNLWVIKRDAHEMGDDSDTPMVRAQQHHLENVAVNAPIQGLANFFCLRAMASIVAWILESKVKAELNLNVHDALVLYCHRSVWRDVAARCRRIMVGQESGCVRLAVDVEVSETNYGEMTKVKDLN